MQVLNTNKTSAELLLPITEDYIIEVKATTDGGDGTSSEQIDPSEDMHNLKCLANVSF